MKRIADRVLSMPRSGIRAIMDVAESMEAEVTRLEVGQPHFATPSHIIEAAYEAAKSGFTRYTPNAGLVEVRRTIAEKAKLDYPNLNVNENNLIITSGGVYALALSIMGITSPGHKIMIPDPGWPNYTLQTIAAGAIPSYYPLYSDNGYKPNLEDLERIVTKDTDLIIVNSPANPTGAVFDEQTMKELVAFAEKHDLYVISDEVYDKVVFEGQHVPMATFDAGGRVITVNSFSKSYSMTGWRLGYAIVPEGLAQEFVKISEALIACPSSVSQKAAEAAVTGPQDYVPRMVDYYKQNRDIAVQLLRKAGIPVVVPHGAFYMLVDISKSGLDSMSFAIKLLKSKYVAVSPGVTFGPSGDSSVRISFCTDRGSVETGVKRFIEFLLAQDPSDYVGGRGHVV